jgi:hypothetical protein
MFGEQRLPRWRVLTRSDQRAIADACWCPSIVIDRAAVARDELEQRPKPARALLLPGKTIASTARPALPPVAHQPPAVVPGADDCGLLAVDVADCRAAVARCRIASKPMQATTGSSGCARLFKLRRGGFTI